MFVLRPGPPQRAPFALRAGLCMAVPVLVGWAVGDIGAGLLATIGAFTSLYGANRPYVHRAGFLAGLAACLALFVALGDWTASIPWLGVLTVCVVAVIATFVCNALAVGPPGAYMLVLACAAGTGLSGAQVPPWQVGLLVLAGGAFAWLVHMAGALAGFRRPEREAVEAAAQATARYVGAVGSAEEAPARHQAAQALHACWMMLVNFQAGRRSSPALDALRVATLRLHALFADVMRAAAAGTPVDPDAADHARSIGALTDDRLHAPGLSDTDRVPLGRPGTFDLLRRAAAPGSPIRSITLRVGIAAVVAGFIALLLGIDHSYWAIAAAVLVLHQGFDWIRTLQRGIERLIGTFIGLGLAGLVLTIAPGGVWLALTLGVLQFTIEMLVIRNYALAVIFITPTALTIAFGAHHVESVGALLAARGIDTVIGCAVALLVFGLLMRRRTGAHLDRAVVDALRAVLGTVQFVADRTVDSAAARVARRDLQLSLMGMLSEFDRAVGGSDRERRAAERMWPTVVAAEDLGYRVLAACWQIEHGEPGAAAEPVLEPAELEPFTAAVGAVIAAIEGKGVAGTSSELPAFGSAEVHRLRRSIVAEEN
jgi:uncharacterized membrane protein YccC